MVARSPRGVPPPFCAVHPNAQQKVCAASPAAWYRPISRMPRTQKSTLGVKQRQMWHRSYWHAQLSAADVMLGSGARCRARWPDDQSG
eukprot:scaffold7004_cov115-Phaeocystis_antarctica.AAC.2